MMIVLGRRSLVDFALFAFARSILRGEKVGETTFEGLLCDFIDRIVNIYYTVQAHHTAQRSSPSESPAKITP